MTSSCVLGSRGRARSITVVALLAVLLGVGALAAPANAQIDIKRGQTGGVMLAKQADCRLSPNGLTARDAQFTVFAPGRTTGANVRTRVVRIIDGKAVQMPGTRWSGWQQVLPAKPVQFRGGYVWTGKVRARLEVAHLVEFWGLRGGLIGATLAVQNRYLTTQSSAPDFGSLGPWLPVQRYCQTPRR